MPGFDYKKAQRTALDLINKFGQVVTLSKTNSIYDPVTGQVSFTAKDSTSATVVSLPASGANLQTFDDSFKEDLNKGKARLFYIAAKGLSFEPDAGQYFEFDGKIWELAGATPLNPAGTPVLYMVGVNLGGNPTTPTS